MVKARKSPIVDPELEEFLSTRALNLDATTDLLAALPSADIVLIATPTDYDPNTNYFDVSSVEKVAFVASQHAPDATIVIKSTIPVGCVEKLRNLTGNPNIIFSPEFLREGRALYDNLNPSRIIVGDQSERAKEFAQLLVQGAKKTDIPVLFTGPSEAEAIKLFANTYLAMRVAYFNELDSYSIAHGLDCTPNYRWGRLGSQNWKPLQQPLIWLRRILSAERYQAASRQLFVGTAKSHNGNCRRQPHAKRFLGRTNTIEKPESSGHPSLGDEGWV